MSDARDPSTIAHAQALTKTSVRWDVRVATGPDTGAVLAVSARSPGRMLVGTGEACELRMSDRRVSRRHLALEATELGLRVTDLGSTNGTTIAGLRAIDAYCGGGEILTIGDSTLRVDVAEAEIDAPDVRMAFGPLIGASLAMRRLYRTCDVLAASRAPLLVEGEEGTGKALLAIALHGDGVVVVEGAEIAEALADDGALLLADARDGCVFVREIGDAPLDAQPALARFVGLAASRGVRVVASTRRNLDAEVERGTFREELARQLSARIELPPLRQRRGDIALLVERFCRDLGLTSAAIPPKKLAALNRHVFPGNVRELRATVANLLADAGAPIADVARASSASTPATPTPMELGVEISYRDILESRAPFAEAKTRVVDRFAAAYVTYAVAIHGGHVARAAAASGLAPRYFNLLRARARAGEDA